MPRTIRFHLDESCAGSVAKGLRLHGIDVTTSKDVGLVGATDEEQLAFANSEGRVILTHDSDFVGLNQVGAQHSGIVYCHRLRRSLGEIIRGLIVVWEVYEPEEMANQIEYL